MLEAWLQWKGSPIATMVRYMGRTGRNLDPENPNVIEPHKVSLGQAHNEPRDSELPFKTKVAGRFGI